MTPAQRARGVGFLASLSVRGVALTVQPAGPPIRFLVERIDPDQGEFSVARETAAGTRLHALRSDLANASLNVGSVLRDDAVGVTYRVTTLEDNPANIAVVLTCENSPEPTP